MPIVNEQEDSVPSGKLIKGLQRGYHQYWLCLCILIYYRRVIFSRPFTCFFRLVMNALILESYCPKENLR